MAGGKGTHSTENRLEMEAAVEASLGVLGELVDLTPVDLAEVRAEFLDELRKRGHVVGHVTDRHHELLRLCAELVDDHTRDPATWCPGCGRSGGEHWDPCCFAGIAAIVANPLRGDK